MSDSDPVASDSDPAESPAPNSNPPETAPSAPWGARAVLALGIVLGFVGICVTILRHADLLGVDLKVYYHAATAALAGGDFYAVSPPGHHYSYVYPPVTIPAFYPYGLLGGWKAAFAVHTLVNVAAAVGVAFLLVRYVRRYRPLATVDAVLLGGYVLLSLHSVPSILYGEVNFPLLLSMVAGFLWLQESGTRRDSAASRAQTKAGVAFALPAVVKIFPAAVGLWLLRRKAWRAIAAAIATGVGLFAVGFAAFGVDTHRTYVHAALVPRLSNAEFVGGLAPTAQLVTLRRPLSVLFPSLPPSAYGLLAFALLAPVVAYCYRDVDDEVADVAVADSDGETPSGEFAGASDPERPPLARLVGVFATLVAMVVGFPSLLLYFSLLYFPMLPLLYLLERGPARTLFVAGAFVANFALTLANVETLVAGTPVPDAALAALEPVLTLATPPLYGAALMLAGCVAWKRGRSRASDADAEASASGTR